VPASSTGSGGELVGRELGERAGAAVGWVHEFDQIGIGRLEDVHDGTTFATREPLLGHVLAQLDPLETPVATGRLAPAASGGRTLS